MKENYFNFMFDLYSVLSIDVMKYLESLPLFSSSRQSEPNFTIKSLNFLHLVFRPWHVIEYRDSRVGPDINLAEAYSA